jgi:ribosomal protein S18 acetylase RimI-like enzyme
MKRGLFCINAGCYYSQMSSGETLAVQIRGAQVNDAARLALVGQATFLETFAGILDGDDVVAHCAREHGLAHYEAALAKPDTQLWLAEAAPGQAPVGYAMTCPPALPVGDVGPDDVELKRIYLLHRFHGTGVGKRLMDSALDGARRARKRRALLGVYAHNRRAIAFYERHGFVAIGTRRFSVGANHYDDLVLALPLTDAA